MYPGLQYSVGQVWRFAPMVDPLVSEFHSRDLDSIISNREFAAVNDWLSNTNRTFHIMRDHKQHGSAIPGEMFCKFLNHSYVVLTQVSIFYLKLYQIFFLF